MAIWPGIHSGIATVMLSKPTQACEKANAPKLPRPASGCSGSWTRKLAMSPAPTPSGCTTATHASEAMAFTADVVVDNDGTIDDLHRLIEAEVLGVTIGG